MSRRTSCRDTDPVLVLRRDTYYIYILNIYIWTLPYSSTVRGYPQPYCLYVLALQFCCNITLVI
uniref:Uncharacterized protein n=1 Tax=Anguilla anguilla TaxID=7936 RepID=A0A0E9T1Q3_ANGAN